MNSIPEIEIKGAEIFLGLLGLILIFCLIASAYNLYIGGKKQSWDNIMYSGILLIIYLLGTLILIFSVYKMYY